MKQIKSNKLNIILIFIIVILIENCVSNKHSENGTILSEYKLTKKDSIINEGENITILRGKVNIGHFNEPAAYSTIYTNDRQVVIKVDTNGFFYKKIPIGTYSLNFNYLGYKKLTTELIKFKQNEVVILDVVLGYDYVE